MGTKIHAGTITGEWIELIQSGALER